MRVFQVWIPCLAISLACETAALFDKLGVMMGAIRPAAHTHSAAAASSDAATAKGAPTSHDDINMAAILAATAQPSADLHVWADISTGIDPIAPEAGGRSRCGPNCPMSAGP